MKLKNAAQTTAYCGRNTRVETTVAIELAAELAYKLPPETAGLMYFRRTSLELGTDQLVPGLVSGKIMGRREQQRKRTDRNK